MPIWMRRATIWTSIFTAGTVARTAARAARSGGGIGTNKRDCMKIKRIESDEEKEMSLVIKRMREMINAEKLRGKIGFGF